MRSGSSSTNTPTSATRARGRPRAPRRRRSTIAPAGSAPTGSRRPGRRPAATRHPRPPALREAADLDQRSPAAPDERRRAAPGRASARCRPAGRRRRHETARACSGRLDAGLGHAQEPLRQLAQQLGWRARSTSSVRRSRALTPMRGEPSSSARYSSTSSWTSTRASISRSSAAWIRSAARASSTRARIPGWRRRRTPGPR